MTREFARLMSELWDGAGGSIRPAAFKRAMAGQAAQFHGCEQHDLQEYMRILLDCLHEGLNRVKVRASRWLRTLHPYQDAAPRPSLVRRHDDLPLATQPPPLRRQEGASNLRADVAGGACR